MQAVVEAGFQLPAQAVDADAQRVHGDAQLLGEGLAVADVAVALVVFEHQLLLVRLKSREALAEAIEPAVSGLFFGHHG